MEDLQQTERVNLLTLPRCDVGLSMPSERKTDKSDPSDDEPSPSQRPAPASYPSLLLLQLPPKWKAEQLKDARFVIPNPQSNASLVVEDAQKSFCLQRVETSNALVLVPPSSQQQQQQQRNSPAKRRKVTEEGKPLQVVQARLLHQGLGAFFLEPKAMPCRLADLRALLPVWDPTASTATAAPPAVTLDTLGNALAKSRAELVTALRQLQAVAVDANRYCRITEEGRLDVLDAVLATLVEAFPHYIKEGIPVSEFIQSARVRLPKILQQQHEQVAQLLICFVLSTLTADNHHRCIMKDTTTTMATVHLHVPRVGAAVASRILTRQTEWEESLLLARWQTEMPGVDCQVSTDWLAGHAVRVAKTESVTAADDTTKKATTTVYYWKYLPAVAVVETSDAAVVWQRLVQALPEWTTQALRPYLDAWQSFTGQGSATILRHAAVRQVEGGLSVYYARE